MRWSVLPVSVAIHLAAIALLLVVSIVADLELPSPWPQSLRNYVVASAAPAPAPLPVDRPRSTRTSPTAAPLAAPDRIADEVIDPGATPAVDGGLPFADLVGSGLPAGVGSGTEAIVPPSPPPAESPQIFRVGRGIREPRKVVDVPVVYPEIARQARIAGLVIIEATIDERGVVTNARVLRSQPLLDAAALTALSQWRYTPTLMNGVPVRVLMTVTFNFTLDSRAP